MRFRVIEGGGGGKSVFGAKTTIERTPGGGWRVRKTLLRAVFFVSVTLFVINGGLR